MPTTRISFQLRSHIIVCQCPLPEMPLWHFFKLRLLIQNMIISVYLLCVGGHSLIISDQEDESIWTILQQRKIDCQIFAIKHRALFYNLDCWFTVMLAIQGRCSATNMILWIRHQSNFFQTVQLLGLSTSFSLMQVSAKIH